MTSEQYNQQQQTMANYEHMLKTDRRWVDRALVVLLDRGVLRENRLITLAALLAKNIRTLTDEEYNYCHKTIHAYANWLMTNAQKKDVVEFTFCYQTDKTNWKFTVVGRRIRVFLGHELQVEIYYPNKDDAAVGLETWKAAVTLPNVQQYLNEFKDQAVHGKVVLGEK